MNFLFFATSNFKPETGGVAELGHRLAEALNSRSHGVTVIASCLERRQKEISSSYAIVRTTKKNLVQEAEKIIARQYIDGIFILIIASSWHTAHALGKKYHIPVILYIHGIEIIKKNNVYPLYWLKQYIKGLMLKKTDLLFCNSAFTASLALKRGARADRVFVLHPGILPCISATIPAKDPAPGKTVFFTMGRLVRRKGADYTIRALSLLANDCPDILYVIGGSGPEDYEEELKKLVRELCLEEHVVFLGSIDDDTKNLWYQRHDVFIMPSRQLPDGDVEGFGIVFLEAALYGKPVIAGRSGGIPDAVEDGKSGVLVDPDSIHAIAEGMKYFIANLIKRKEMGEYGRNRAKNDFNWLRQADNFIMIVQNFAKSFFDAPIIY
jgi:phosphatidylinositol alpha-1,6-mannosyltransferase